MDNEAAATRFLDWLDEIDATGTVEISDGDRATLVAAVAALAPHPVSIGARV